MSDNAAQARSRFVRAVDASTECLMNVSSWRNPGWSRETPILGWRRGCGELPSGGGRGSPILSAGVSRNLSRERVLRKMQTEPGGFETLEIAEVAAWCRRGERIPPDRCS